MASKAQRQAVARYDRANTVQFKVKLNKVTDADIIDVLEAVENRQGYIKELIRADILRENIRTRRNGTDSDM